MSNKSNQAIIWIRADVDGREDYFTELTRYFLFGYYNLYGFCAVGKDGDDVRLVYDLSSYSGLRAVFDDFRCALNHLRVLAPDLKFNILAEGHWEHSDDSVEDIWTECDTVRYRRFVRVSRTDAEDQLDFPEM